MNKKFISICLIIFSIIALLSSIAVVYVFYSQPIFYSQDTITLAPEFSCTPAQKPVWLLFFSAALPWALVGLCIFVGCFLLKKYFHRIKKHIPVALCILLCITCLGGSLLISNSFAVSSFTPVESSQYYGRRQLEKMVNSSSLLYAYDQMVEGIENYSSEIQIRTFFNSVTLDEWKVVLYSYLYDYPQHFWMDSSYRYSYVNGSNNEVIVHAILPNYAFSQEELINARAEFDSEAQEILNTLSPAMSQYELELSIHNQLCQRITYQDKEHAHNAYGGMVTGYAVCEGYGKAFQYLLNQVGIESTLATGTGTTASGSTENHAWNLVKIDGDYYYTDLTWDDQSEPYYGYFNVTTAMLEEDHSIATFPYELPLCTATKENYFVKNDKVFTSFSLDKIVQALTYNLSTHVYVTGNDSTFNSNVLNNSRAIINALDMVTTANIRITSLGRERLITVIGHRRGDVNGDNILDEKDVALLTEYFTTPDAITDADCLKAADFNKDGTIDEKDSKKLANYIEGIADDDPSSTPASSATPVSSVPSTPSSTTSVPSSTPSVPSVVSSTPIDPSSMDKPTDSVITSSENDNSSTTTYKLGDINDDGIINAKDALIVLKATVGRIILSAKQEMIAEVDGKPGLNAKDALVILKYAVGRIKEFPVEKLS